ncbi:hypothetical protein LEN26_017002 [Aphanomyces euteiches]|nr:hypothetical protein LEN26_017002 [Aphanomyces euteiches]
MKSTLLLCVFLAASVSGATHRRGATIAEVNSPVGGWFNASLDDAKAAYYEAAALDDSYPTSNTKRVCATTFNSAQQQVVAGINYKISLAGCSVKSVNDTANGCQCASGVDQYTVIVYKRLQDTPLITLVAQGVNATESIGLAVGGFSAQRDVTADDKAIFANSTSSDSNYYSAALPRVCATDFVSVSTQVVAGTNYLFTVKGCQLDKADSNSVKDCAATCASKAKTSYQVKIYRDLQQSTKVMDVITATSTGSFLADSSGNSTSSSDNSTAIGTAATTATPTTTLKSSSFSMLSVSLVALTAAWAAWL